MRINNNIMAMNTHRQYTINTNSVSKSMEKLSSGYRVNRAGDDAAGLAISEKMRAQIRGLRMASKNSSDAISLVQTAEGALQESHNVLQRMRELAVQSASDTNETSIDRAALDAEFQQLIKELDDTAAKTKFNNMGVIDGSYSGSGTTTNILAGNGTAYLTEFVGSTGMVATDTYTLTSGTDADGNFLLTLENSTGAIVGSLTLTDIQIGLLDYKTGDDVRLQLNDGSALRFVAQSDITDVTTLAADVNAAMDGNDTDDIVWTGKPITIQTGANQGDELQVNIAAMDATILGVNKSSIAQGRDARHALSRTNDALNAVSTQRATLGALQNRLNHKINNLDTSAENLSAAESRIRDLDMAQEMTTFTRNNILVQASTAMLAQANAAPQGVLQLLQ